MDNGDLSEYGSMISQLRPNSGFVEYKIDIDEVDEGKPTSNHCCNANKMTTVFQN